MILQFYSLYYLGVWAMRNSKPWVLTLVGIAVALAGALVRVYAYAWLQRLSGPIPATPNHTGELSLLAHPLTLVVQLSALGEYAFFPSFAFVVVGMLVARAPKRRAGAVVAAGFALLGCTFAATALVQAVHSKPIGYYRDSLGHAHLTRPRLVQLSSEAHLSTKAFLDHRVGKRPSDGDIIALALLPDNSWRSPWRLATTGEHSQMLGWISMATAFALLIIGGSGLASRLAPELIRPLAVAGTCSLTFYVLHLLLINLYWSGFRSWLKQPFDGVAKAVLVFIVFVVAANFWKSRYRRGPLESANAAIGEFTARRWRAIMRP